MQGESEQRKGAVLKVLLPRSATFNAAVRSESKSNSMLRMEATLDAAPASPPPRVAAAASPSNQS